jgi:hypothetical protein
MRRCTESTTKRKKVEGRKAKVPRAEDKVGEKTERTHIFMRKTVLSFPAPAKVQRALVINSATALNNTFTCNVQT